LCLKSSSIGQELFANEQDGLNFSVMPRYVLEVMYDGTKFHGSQMQGTIPTVQLSLNNALSTLFRIPMETLAASRTDEGVHALCNYFQFDTEEALPHELLYKCNAVLPRSIAVKKIWKAANPEFSARFDAIRRQYRYCIYNTKNPFLVDRALFYPFHLQHDLLNETAAIIKEYDHFESFAKRKSQTKTFTCTIHQSYWEYNGTELHYIVEANRFLRGMVRGLVGTQLQTARGNITTQDFRKIIEGRDCTKAFFNVAGHGLYLENVVYPAGVLEEIDGVKPK
jgi:tRNA pseudouridine38-40 synthase